MPDKAYIDKIVFVYGGMYIQMGRKCGCGWMDLLSRVEQTTGVYVCVHAYMYVCVLCC